MRVKSLFLRYLNDEYPNELFKSRRQFYCYSNSLQIIKGASLLRLDPGTPGTRPPYHDTDSFFTAFESRGKAINTFRQRYFTYIILLITLIRAVKSCLQPISPQPITFKSSTTVCINAIAVALHLAPLQTAVLPPMEPPEPTG